MLLSSIFQLNFLTETKVTDGLKFKTRETATTTSPFYTRRHREHFNVRKTTETVKTFNVELHGTGGKFFECFEVPKSSDRCFFLRKKQHLKAV